MLVLEPEDMNAAFGAAYNSGEIERLLALYEPDAVLAPQPGLRAVGLEEIREALTGLLGLGGSMRSENLYCMRSGNIALLQGSWSIATVDQHGKPFDLGSRTAEVVRRQPDGSWLYVADHAFAND
jgi:ketosteroid isomerase-like protein